MIVYRRAAAFENAAPDRPPVTTQVHNQVKLSYIRNRQHMTNQGFTLIELVLIIAIVSIISAIAVVSYSGYIEASNQGKAISEITVMSLSITDFQLDNKRFPDSLNEAGLANMTDPWGNPYQYLNIETGNGNGQNRKDHNLVPLNSDFDLYSMGPDGSSVSPLTSAPSRDDIIRANNGSYIGLASEY